MTKNDQNEKDSFLLWLTEKKTKNGQNFDLKVQNLMKTFA